MLKMMSASISHNTRKILLLLLFILSGCATTHLDAPPLTHDYLRLAAANKRTLTYSVSGPKSELKVGHQYLFFVFPVGKVLVDSPTDTFMTGAYRKLAERGYSPQHLEGDPQAHLQFELKTLSVTAYDFFFFRMVNCSVEFLAKKEGTDLEIEFEGSASNPRLAGFKPQLQVCLESALDDGLSRALKDLAL